MRVLEINGFAEKSFCYDGEHEVKRFLIGRGDRSRDEKRALEGKILRTLSEVRTFNPDVLVCRAMGRSYGRPAWKRPLKYWVERQNVRKVAELKNRLQLPLGIVDTTDDLVVHPVNRGLLSACDRYFKRELAMDPFLSLGGFESSRYRRPERRRRLEIEKQGWHRKLSPLTLGTLGDVPTGERKPFAERNWDIFSVGDETQRPLRAEGQLLLDELENKGLKVFRPSQRLDKGEYFAAMADSRVVFSPPGFGWDCHRHYEAALMDCVVFTTLPNIRHSMPWKDRENILYYDPCAQDTVDLHTRLTDHAELERIAERGRILVEDQASHEAIFDQVVRELAEC